MSSDTFLYNSLFFNICIREDFTNNHLWTWNFWKKKMDFMGAARKKCWAWKTSPWLFAKKIIRGLNRLHKSPKVQPPPFSDLPPPFSDLPPPFSALPPPFLGHLGVASCFQAGNSAPLKKWTPGWFLASILPPKKILHHIRFHHIKKLICDCVALQ